MHFMWGVFFVVCFFGGCFATNCKGCVPLDTYSFDKVISKFKAAVIKFDIFYPFGPKHEEFAKIAEATHNIPDLLIGEVGVKDYGEKENSDLAARYGVNKNDFPVVKVFVSGKEDHYTFSEEDFTEAALKKFIRSKTGIRIGLQGCLESFDNLATKFVTASPNDRRTILREAEDLWDQMNTSSDRKTAEVYVKTMRKVLDKGIEFVASEVSRVQNLTKGKVSKDKKEELQRRLNILHSFHHDEL